MLREFADEIGKVHLPSVLFFAVEPLRMRRHASADRGDNALASDGPTLDGPPASVAADPVTDLRSELVHRADCTGKHALAACDAPLHHAAPAAARGLRPRKACKTPGGARNREPSGLCGGGRTNSPVRLDVRAHLLAEGDASLVVAAHLRSMCRTDHSDHRLPLQEWNFFLRFPLPQLAQPDAGTIKIVVTSPCRRFRQWFLRSVRLATDVYSGNPRARSL